MGRDWSKERNALELKGMGNVKIRSSSPKNSKNLSLETLLTRNGITILL